MTQIMLRAMRWGLVLAVATAAASALDTTSVAVAQPAMALGRPLPDSGLPTGTVTVRVIEGSPSTPGAGQSVTLTVNGKPREARTDATGRATFADLPAGATVKASVADADGKPIESEEFGIPSAGGARVMLSTKPFTGGTGGVAPPIGGGAAPAAPMMGGGGMPEARAVSGQPKPDGTNAPGTYSVRLTYNNLTFGASGPQDTAPPVGETVYMVGYGSDDSIKVMTAQVDAAGNTVFEGLDTTGNVAYYALGALVRGENVDRLISDPVTLGPQGGARVVLSGLARDATAPGVDDYQKEYRSKTVAPPSGVRVVLDGQANPGLEVDVIDTATMKPLATAKTVAVADPSKAQAAADIKPLPGRAGEFEITVRGGPGTAMDPLPGAKIQVFDPQTKEPVEGGVGVVGFDGTLKLTAKPPADGTVVLVLSHNDIDTPSEPLNIATQGYAFDIVVQWPQTGGAEAVLDVPPGKVVFAEVKADGQTYRSRPMLTVPGTGAAERVSVYPRAPLMFEAVAFAEDKHFVVQGSFMVRNFSWAPLRTSKDGLIVELPARHVGAVVGGQYQNDVAVAEGQGFRIMRPIPPRGIMFTAGWSQPISDGEVELSMPMPRGAIRSKLSIRQYPGMIVRPGPGLQGKITRMTTGDDYYVMDNIFLQSGKPLTLGISGLPAHAGWKRWMPRLLGIVVICIILGGIGFALARPAAAARPAVDGSRRDKLLDELVELEKRGIESAKDRQRRDKLIDELERMWGQT